MTLKEFKFHCGSDFLPVIVYHAEAGKVLSTVYEVGNLRQLDDEEILNREILFFFIENHGKGFFWEIFVK